jgi:glycosyltransferase involved in cell wall biosynthesis
VCGYVVPIGSNIDCAPASEPSRADLRRLLGAGDDTLLVGYFGFLNPSKGVPTLLSAIRAVAAQRSVRLALIGAETGVSNPTDQPEAHAVQEAIRQTQMSHLVISTGHLPPPDLSAALLACDVVALPFRDGASARRGTLMAALAHGLPVVTTLPARAAPVAGPPAIWLGSGPNAAAIRDGVSALLVPPDDADALAAALLRLAADAALRDQIAAGAQAIAARIAWPVLAAETAAIYAATLGSARP